MTHVKSIATLPQTRNSRRQYTLACGVLLCLLASQTWANPAAPQALASPETEAAAQAQLNAQHDVYSAARKALRKRQVTRYRELLPKLGDYPLKPYLEYRYLIARMTRKNESAIANFIVTYRNTHLGLRLHRAWLPSLFRRKRYQTLIDSYFPRDDVSLQCLYVRAHIRIGKFDDSLRPLLNSIWLHGKSRPKICDPLLDWFRNNGLNEELVWQRTKLVLQVGNTRLARYLKRFLPADSRRWVDLWIQVHRNPNKYLRDKRLVSGHAYATDLIEHGIKLLARGHPLRAQARLERFIEAGVLHAKQIDTLRYHVAVSAASDGLTEAYTLLDAIPAAQRDAQWHEVRLRLTLRNSNWHRILRAATALPNTATMQQMGAYWRARALEQTGRLEESQKHYQDVAKQRSFYGFLAAERLQQPYAFNHHPYPVSEEKLRAVAFSPTVARAREFLYHGDIHNAREEWDDLLHYADAITLSHAAVLAHDWGWAEGVIRAFGKARAFDDLTRRFPQRYADVFVDYAGRNEVDVALTFALARRESNFAADTRSSAGAVGVMQLMPGTARQVARQLGLKRPNTRSLRDPTLNIRLGTHYFRRMLEKFGGNPAMALAAYNAGPAAVQRWLPKERMEADIWIDTIPYHETRKYVRTVLEYAAVYRLLAEKPVQPLWPSINPIRHPR